MSKVLISRLALALRASAARFRHCDPRTDEVLDSVADYLERPEEARARITQEEESLRRMRRTR